MPVFAQDYAPEQLVGHARPGFGLLFVLWGGLGRTYVFQQNWDKSGEHEHCALELGIHLFVAIGLVCEDVDALEGVRSDGLPRLEEFGS